MMQPEAEVIASAVSIIRPAWLKTSLMTLLAKQRHRPARQVALALVYLAYDPEVKSPGLLLKDGPWWGVAGLAEPTAAPYYDRSPSPAEPHPMTDPAAIHALRLAAKAARASQHPTAGELAAGETTTNEETQQ